MEFIHVQQFEEWRREARRLVCAGVHPDDVCWGDDRQQPSLFDSFDSPSPSQSLATESKTKTFSVPKPFLELARVVACHREPDRWSLLYRTLWRLKNGEPQLMRISTDDDIHRLSQMKKAITRDVHKMKAFVRFRRVVDGSGEESFIAWHRPDHRIVRLAAPFFSRRFKEMTWTIMTPDASVHWDQQKLNYGPGMARSEAPSHDELEELWKTYYASIFNPARVKVAMMKSEMPVRHWPTLPEAELIQDLLHESDARVSKMIEQQEGFADTATKFMPDANAPDFDFNSIRQAASLCQACDLHHDATQTVFGVGPTDARLVLVGEQPGDKEDEIGEPFVGPAGSLLDDCLRNAGIDRSQVYLTNTVKHFKHTIRGKRRIHKKPDSREIYACRPWLEAELAIIQPAKLLCLGATAAQALIGRDFRITKDRGRYVETDWCQKTMATWHPAAILRMQDEERRVQMESQLTEDLRRCAR